MSTGKKRCLPRGIWIHVLKSCHWVPAVSDEDGEMIFMVNHIFIETLQFRVVNFLWISPKSFARKIFDKMFLSTGTLMYWIVLIQRIKIVTKEFSSKEACSRLSFLLFGTLPSFSLQQKALSSHTAEKELALRFSCSCYSQAWSHPIALEAAC